MAQQAIGMIETRGLVPLLQAADAALKAASVTLTGWKRVGSGLCTVFVAGDVAAVRASVDAGAEAARQVGEVVRVHVIPRPHDEMTALLPHDNLARRLDLSAGPSRDAARANAKSPNTGGSKPKRRKV